MQGVPLLYFVVDRFSHLIWGSDKPVLRLTDSKELTRFFQAKTIHNSPWNHVESYSIQQSGTHSPGKIKSAGDLPSRLKPNPNRTIELKLAERNPVRETEKDVREKTNRQNNQWALYRRFTRWPTSNRPNKHTDNPQPNPKLRSSSPSTGEFDIKLGTTTDEIQNEKIST